MCIPKIDAFQYLYLKLRALVSLKNSVINDEGIPAHFVSQRLHGFTKDPGREQCSNVHPVDVDGVFEAVDCILPESGGLAGIYVWKHAAVMEQKAEQVSNEVHHLESIVPLLKYIS